MSSAFTRSRSILSGAIPWSSCGPAAWWPIPASTRRAGNGRRRSRTWSRNAANPKASQPLRSSATWPGPHRHSVTRSASSRSSSCAPRRRSAWAHVSICAPSTTRFWPKAICRSACSANAWTPGSKLRLNDETLNRPARYPWGRKESLEMDRRRFLQHAGCALCTPAADRLFFRGTDAAAAAAYENLDPAARLKLADMALELAFRAGATYADMRIGRTEHEFLRARDRRLEDLTSDLTVGFGVRVLLDGSWGFAGSQRIEEAEIRRVVGLAVENAKAARLIQAVPITLENVPAYREDWRTPVRIDPFSISTDVKAAKLLAINETALTAGASYCTSLMRFVREEKLFASSRGSQITQVRVRSAPHFEVTGIDRQSGRFASRASLAAPRGEGWEYIERHDFLAEAALAAQQVQQKLRAKPVAPGKYDLVLDPTNLWLTIHESVGHSTELDRALGWEANFAGTSFVTPEKLGAFQYGSPLMM